MNWYQSLSRDEKRTFWACYGGFSLDAMDVMLFSFVVPTLLGLWAMSKAEAGTIATVTLLTSAVGGWVAGMLSDRFGRVIVLQGTILWYAVFTFCCGFAQGPHELMLLRGLQGFGFGGEWSAGAVLMGEVAKARFRGTAVGFVQSSWAVGWGIAALAATILLATLPAHIAWRVLFFLGLSPAILVFFVRRMVPESPLFLAAQKAERKRAAPGHGRFSLTDFSLMLRGSLLAMGVQGGYYAITTWMPTFLRVQRHLSVIGSSYYLALIIFGSLVGYIASALLTDRVGRRLNFVIFAVGSAIIIMAYSYIPITNTEMLFLSLPLGFFATGIFSGMGSFYTELFPTRIRATAQGFCYNSGRGLAAGFPLLTGLAAGRMQLGHAIALFAVLAYGIVLLAIFLLPETRGRDLAQFEGVLDRKVCSCPE
jgi:MFS family permease